ncbi:MAG: hypothetical protein KAS26_03560, partial [Sulfurimonas sp.]|nr:hypothetical protein [Sulfurimonas sp.]
MHTIINEYFLELVAAVSIIALLLLYTLVKISNKKVDVDSEEEVEIEIESNNKPVKKEEVEKKPESKPDVPVTTERMKRELVPHDKITKDDFSIFSN